MINQNNIPNFHKLSDEFTSYFSVIPELPELGDPSPRGKSKKSYSLKSLDRQIRKKSISISKNGAESGQKRSLKMKKEKQGSNKMFSVASNFDQIQSFPSTKWGSRQMGIRQVVSHKFKDSKKSANFKNSEAQLTFESMTSSAGKSSRSQGKLQYKIIYARFINLLRTYQHKIEKLQRQNKKLKLSNHLMRLHLKNIKL